MEKENNNSIEDILKLLKDEVENTPSEEIKSEDSTPVAELDDESVKERLREQYGIGGNESASDEYALDESFMLDAEAEDYMDEEAIEVSNTSLDEIISEDEPQIMDFTERTEEEAVALLSEDEVNSDEDSLEEYIEPEDESGEEYAEDVVELDSEIIDVELREEVLEEYFEIKQTSTPEDNADDDLPWFDDEPVAAKEESLDEPIEDPCAVDATIENFEEVPLLVDDLVDESGEFSIEATSDEVENHIETTDAPAEEEKNDSFYRTIMDAEHETLAKRAAMRQLDELMVEDSFVDSENDGEYDFDGEEAKSILGAEGDQLGDGDSVADGDLGARISAKDSFEKKYGISTDFYDNLEHEQTADAAPSAEEVGEGVDFESETEDEEAEETQEVTRISVWETAKPVIMGVLAFLILLLELLPIFDIVPKGLLDYTDYGAIYILLDLQLLIFMGILLRKRLIGGIVRIAKQTMNVYSVLAVTAIISVIYSIIACFLTGDGMPPLYNSVSALYMLAAYIIEEADRKRIKRSISTLLVGEEIYSVRRSHGKNSTADKMYLGGISPDTNIYEPATVKGTGYAKNFASDREYTTDKTVVYAITPVVIFSALMGVVAMVRENDFVYVLNSMISTFLFLVPLTAIVSSFLPIYISYLRLFKRGCFISNARAAKFAGECDALVFEDRHLFAAANPKDNGIKIYAHDKTNEILGALDALYSAIGGPMERVFSGANERERRVRIIRITRSGLEAVIDDRSSIIVGSSDYLLRYGINTDAGSSKGTNMGILYVALDSRLVAKMSLNYRTEPLFEHLSEVMGDDGINTVIETYDPVISSGYIAYCRKAHKAKYPVSVVHKNKGDYYRHDRRRVFASKSGVFAVASRLKLVELLTFCKRITKVTRLNSIIRSVAFGLAAVLSVVFTVLGTMQYINAIWVLVYQLVLLAIFTVMSVRVLPMSLDSIKNNKTDK